MAYTTINKSSDYFNTKLYTGNDSAGHAITGVGFKPDFLWVKNRSSGQEHYLADIVRGVTKDLQSNSSSAEATSSNLTSFDSDGFTIGGSDRLNQGSSNLVAWNWLAGGSQGSSNTDGSINTTYTSVNTTAGFSISSYTGTGSNATVGHGLGVAPKMIIFKNLSSGNNWDVYHGSLANTERLNLNENSAKSTAASAFNSTSPTTSVFSIGTAGNTNESGSSMIAYAFAEKTGYSKFGSYTGNGASDGSFIYTGFKPAFVMVKNTDAARNWTILDNKRDVFNSCSIRLFPNSSEAEAGTVGSEAMADILSNGFKTKTNDANFNASGNNYIYMAFAEAPLVGSNNVPCTAR